MINNNQKIAISGAGIGGLTLAIALQRLGIDFSIYDKAESFQPLGYGIQVSPNAVRVLHALGLQHQLAAIANTCQRMVFRRLGHAKPLLSWQVKSDVPYYQCLRSDLHTMLYQALDKKSIQYNTTVKTVNDVKEDIIVGADGVHSEIRKKLFPQQQAEFSGYIAYRALVPFDDRFAELKNTTSVWLAKDKHIVVYPVGSDNMINIVLITKQKDQVGDSWVQPVTNEEIMQCFTSNDALLNDLLVHIQQQNIQSYCWGLFDYLPLPGWYKDNQVLLGDAAHPMLPFMAQGAAMAIEDAWALSQSLDKNHNFTAACLQYQKIRYQRASKVQGISRKNAAIFHADGLLALGRDSVFKVIQTIQPQLMQLKTNGIYQYSIIDRL